MIRQPVFILTPKQRIPMRTSTQKDSLTLFGEFIYETQTSGLYMTKEVPEDKKDRDKPERSRTEGVDADENDDNQEGRLHKRGKGYDGTGEDEAITMEQAEDEEREGKPQ
ncbi:MAG: hypothetical protein OK474_05995 [Thaumarchaeota archaeon]|nr:hypothetical protein [Nitrososphaerota archaeon]